MTATGRASDGIRDVAPPQPELPPELARAIERLDELVQAFEQHPEPTLREDVFDMLHCVDTIHRVALRRIFRLLTEAGLLDSALDVPEVRMLLELYQLDQDGEQTRVRSVLDALSPYVESEGGRLQLLEAEGEVTRVRVSAAWRGSKQALRALVEESLQAQLGDVVRVEFVEELPLLPAARPVPRRRGEHPAPEGSRR